MGQQQILLIILGTLIVGIATSVGINLMRHIEPVYPYAIRVQWSEDKQAYAATLQAFPGVVVIGDSPENAVRAAIRATPEEGIR